MRRRSSGVMPSFDMCHVSIASPPFGASAPFTTARARVEVVDVDVERHELVGDPRVARCSAASAQSSAYASISRGSSHGVPGMFPTLMWCAGSSSGGLEEQRAQSGRMPAAARRSGRGTTPTGTRARVAEAVVVEELPHLAQRPRLEHVLEVGVPEPDPAHADARRLRAAVAQVEQAPLPPDVHLDRTGDRPVETEQFVAASHPLPAT